MKNKNWEWTELDSRTVVKTPFVKILNKSFRRPDGAVIHDYYLLEKPGSVQIVAFAIDHKIVLVKQYRVGLGDISIELPAGSIKSNETPRRAAHRELTEETGYRAGELLEISNFSQDTARFTGCAHHLFVARDLRKINRKKLDEDAKEMETIEASFGQVLEMIRKRQIKDLQTIAGILLSQLYYCRNILPELKPWQGTDRRYFFMNRRIDILTQSEVALLLFMITAH